MKVSPVAITFLTALLMGQSLAAPTTAGTNTNLDHQDHLNQATNQHVNQQTHQQTNQHSKTHLKQKPRIGGYHHRKHHGGYPQCHTEGACTLAEAEDLAKLLKNEGKKYVTVDKNVTTILSQSGCHVSGFAKNATEKPHVSSYALDVGIGIQSFIDHCKGKGHGKIGGLGTANGNGDFVFHLGV